MKKIAMFLLVSVLFSVSAMAQKVYGLSKIEQKTSTVFVAYAGEHSELSLEISAWLYRAIKSEPNSYVMMNYVGENGSCRTIARRTSVDYGVYNIDSIGYDEANQLALVYLSNHSVYKSPNMEWLKVQRGQHFERWYVDGETKVLEHCRTVARTVALTTAIPYEIAPRQGATAVRDNGNDQQLELAANLTPSTTKDGISVERVGQRTFTRPALVKE
jgi:hypothetical protein